MIYKRLFLPGLEYKSRMHSYIRELFFISLINILSCVSEIKR